MQARRQQAHFRARMALLVVIGVMCAGAASEALAEELPPPLAHRARVMPAGDGPLHKLASRLGAPGGDVENPCLQHDGVECAQTALDPFFEKLDALALGQADRPVVVEAFGNSLIASDRIVDRVRAGLVRHFGDGGRGVLLVDRMASYGPRTRTGNSTRGWEARTLGELKQPPHPFGLAGVYHVSTEAGATSRFKLDGERRGTFWWVDARGGGGVTIRVDGKKLMRVRSRGTGRSLATGFALPPKARRLEIVADAPGVVAHGVVLDHARPGVVLDTLGVPSADATYFLRADERSFRSQLASRRPGLVMFLLGGNETKRVEWRRTRLERVEKSLRELIRRTRRAAPESACLVVGPIDAVRGPDTDSPGTERPYLQKVNALEREVALAEGCAFFDIYAAMGGAGSFNRFHKAKLAHDDLVHPRGKGLDLLGELLSDAILRAYATATTPRPQPTRAEMVQ